MQKVEFDFCIRPKVVEADRSQHEIASLDREGLFGIGKGKIFIIFEELGDYIVIESEVYDYLDRLLGVVHEIDNGNHETFAVSGDYYSNNLRFTYDTQSKMLQINEANGGSFLIEIEYKEFRSSFLSFFKQAIDDLMMLYIELEENKEFCKKHKQVG